MHQTSLAALIVVAQRSGFDQARPVIIWVGVLIGVAVFGGLAILRLRARMRGDPDESDSGASLLEQVRTMHRQGSLTKEEYETLRRRLSQGVAAKLGVPPSRTTPPGNPIPPSAAGPPGGGAVRAPPGYDLTGERLPRPTPPTKTDQA